MQPKFKLRSGFRCDIEDDDSDEESEDEEDVNEMSERLYTHYCVTCLEDKNDINVMLALKQPVAMKYVLKAREENPELCFAYLDANGNRQDPMHIASIGCPWATIKYLAFGISSDHKKGVAGVDRSPLFYMGDVIVPSSATNEAIVRFIECYETA